MLPTQPIFGLIKSKLDLVTSAFVASGDLTQTGQLVEAFHSINQQLRGVASATSEEHLHGMRLHPTAILFEHSYSTVQEFAWPARRTRPEAGVPRVRRADAAPPASAPSPAPNLLLHGAGALAFSSLIPYISLN